MAVKDKIDNLLAPTVAGLGYEYVGCEYLPQGKYSVLRVYIDSTQGITVDDCAKASRQISAVLDVEEVITGQYNLEVSSPGAERPLFIPAHYEAAKGKTVRLRLHAPLNGQRKFTGIIVGVTENTLTLDINDEPHQFNFDDIEKANLQAKFDI